jgi:hypothetical protein
MEGDGRDKINVLEDAEALLQSTINVPNLYEA